jgi:hypothetical protein
MTCTPVNVLANSPLPFILNTGAMCHISPVKSDFKSLHPIVPHPITSIGGAQVYATGVGSIELCIVSNHKVMLEDILFVPMLIICLVLMLCLNHSGCYTSSFNSNSYWVTNKAGAVILQGAVLKFCHLFGLTLHSPHIGHIHSTTPTNSAHYASWTPNLET